MIKKLLKIWFIRVSIFVSIFIFFILFSKNVIVFNYSSKDNSKIEGSIGVIVIQNIKQGDTIHVYDRNFHIFSRYIVLTDSIVEKYNMGLIKDDPINIYIEFEKVSGLVFMCIDTLRSYYLIKHRIEDENKGEEVAIILKDRRIVFQKWEEHILKNVSFVDFNSKINPIRKLPNENSLIVNKSNQYDYYPVSIQGKWLKIGWIDEFERENFGWIKWQENGKLLVDLFYFY